MFTYITICLVAYIALTAYDYINERLTSKAIKDAQFHQDSVQGARDLLIASCTIKQRALLRFFFKSGSLTCSQFQVNPVLLSFGVLATLIKAGYITKDHGVYALASVYQY